MDLLLTAGRLRALAPWTKLAIVDGLVAGQGLLADYDMVNRQMDEAIIQLKRIAHALDDKNQDELSDRFEELLRRIPDDPRR